jgi:hypothetical protein
MPEIASVALPCTFLIAAHCFWRHVLETALLLLIAMRMRKNDHEKTKKSG